MKQANLPLPELGLIAATRGMLGAGAALLLAEKIPIEKRRKIGTLLLAVGIVSTIPLVMDVVRRSRITTAWPVEDPELTRILEANYDAAEKAFINKDIDTIADLMSPDFVGYDEDGNRKTREDVLDSVRKQFETSDIISWPRKVISLSADGEVATTRVEGVYKGTKLPGRETFQMLIINEDTWQRTPSAGR